MLSETDVVGNAKTMAQAPIRQPDSDHYRTWEVAGAAHFDFALNEALAPVRERDGIPAVPPPCDLPPFSRIPFRYVVNAALDHMVD